MATGTFRVVAGIAGLIFAGGAALAWPRRDAARWLRGAEGERATAAMLDRLPARKWAVLHDLSLPGSRANVDHLVIGRTGAWVIDSKTTRAQIRSRWRSVWFGERRLDPGAVLWEAEVVSDRLGVAVRPLIAVHGEPAQWRGGRAGRVRVVPASVVVRRVKRGRRKLTRPEIASIAERAETEFG